MPHRAFAHNVACHLFEVIGLAFLLAWQGFSAGLAIISDADWAKITGPHGLVFVLIIGLCVVWAKSCRDDVARERRHKETLVAQEEHFAALLSLNSKTAQDLKDLTIQSIKAQMMATAATVDLRKELAGRPCGIRDSATFKTDPPLPSA